MTRPSLRELRRRAEPNVTILPTAAERQVQQRWNAATRAERARLKAEAPQLQGRYASAQMREARERAKAMREIERTPELLVLLTILDTIPRESRTAMIETLAPAAVLGGAPRQAVEIIRSIMLTVGEQLDLHRAQNELAGEGGR